MDHYERLAVDRGASTEEIRAAFRAGMRLHHPDAGGDARGADIDQLVEAWHMLRDPGQRRRYDEHLRSTAELPRAPAYVPPDPTDEDTMGPPAPRTLIVMVAASAILLLVVLFLIVVIGMAQGPTGP